MSIFRNGWSPGSDFGTVEDAGEKSRDPGRICYSMVGCNGRVYFQTGFSVEVAALVRLGDEKCRIEKDREFFLLGVSCCWRAADGKG